MKHPRITRVNTMLRRFISLLTISVVVALVAILVWAAAQWALFVFSVSASNERSTSAGGRYRHFHTAVLRGYMHRYGLCAAKFNRTCTEA
jgi:hypothetical protein